MAIDARQLSYLLAIEEHGSLSRAAAALELSQPALSASIAALERKLNTQVLTRTGKGAVVNEFGEVLVRRARELRSLLQAAETEVFLRKRGQYGPLTVGATPTVVEYLLPRALERFRQEGSNLTLSVIEGLDRQLTALLKAGEIDFMVGAVGQPEPEPDLEEEFLVDDPFVLAVSEESEFAQRKEVSLAETLDSLWIVPMPGGSAYSHVTSIFLNSGIQWPHNCIKTNSTVLVKNMIIESNAVALVNINTLRGWPSSIKRINVPKAGSRKIGIKTRSIAELSPVAERLADILRDLVRE